MNIYLVQEDGENFCIQAESMDTAVNIARNMYLEMHKGDLERGMIYQLRPGEFAHVLCYNEKEEIEYYHQQILQSCQLVGELKNVD